MTNFRIVRVAAAKYQAVYLPDIDVMGMAVALAVAAELAVFDQDI
jgi:hypothetical protein